MQDKGLLLQLSFATLDMTRRISAPDPMDVDVSSRHLVVNDSNSSRSKPSHGRRTAISLINSTIESL